MIAVRGWVGICRGMEQAIGEIRNLYRLIRNIGLGKPSDSEDDQRLRLLTDSLS